jgi:hypothetical protein
VNLYEAIEKHDLSVFTERDPKDNLYHCVVTRKNAPWDQGLARGHRVIIAEATERTSEEAVQKALTVAVEKMEGYTNE